MLSSDGGDFVARKATPVASHALKFINSDWDVVTCLPGGFRLSDSGIEIEVGSPVPFVPSAKPALAPGGDSIPAVFEELNLIVENETLTAYSNAVDASSVKTTTTPALAAPAKVSLNKPSSTRAATLSRS
jgi:hypothetical protein